MSAGKEVPDEDENIRNVTDVEGGKEHAVGRAALIPPPLLCGSDGQDQIVLTGLKRRSDESWRR